MIATDLVSYCSWDLLPKNYGARAILDDCPALHQNIRTDSVIEWLRSAIDQALAAGVTRRHIHHLVAIAPPPTVRGTDPGSSWPDDPSQVIYDEVPRGLLTLADAAEKYGVRTNTLTVAIFRGNLPGAGRLRGRGYGGTQHLVAEEALRRYLGLEPEISDVAQDRDEDQDAPLQPAPGDPSIHEEVEPRPAPDDLAIHEELPEGWVTLLEGARRYDVPVTRMRNWVRTGKLTRMGYLRGKGPQGGLLLLLESELAALVAQQQLNH